MTKEMLQGGIAAAIFLSTIGTIILALGVLYVLAKKDMFWTFVQEGRAKAVTVGDTFQKMLMSYSGHKFDESKDGVDRWNVVEDTSIAAARPGKMSFLSGLHWVGIYPFVKVHRYDFTWTSLVQSPGADGSTQARLVTKKENMSHVLVQADTYAFILPSVNTVEGIPLDLHVNFVAQIVNPYKALYEVQHWLETINNRLSGELRPFFGTKTYQQINGLKTSTGSGALDLDDAFKELTDDFRNLFGVDVKHLSLTQADPSTKEAEDAIKAQNLVYEAKQKAEAINIVAEAETKRITNVYKAASKVKGGSGMLAVEALRDSKITVYAPSGDGKSLMPSIAVADATNKS